MKPRTSLVSPAADHLIEEVGSKFGLVTLAARRGRQINQYYTQLGEGLGKIVPPQVPTVARKSLSIAFEEISAQKIVAVEGSDPLGELEGTAEESSEDPLL